jgi:signal peptidase I
MYRMKNLSFSKLKTYILELVETFIASLIIIFVIYMFIGSVEIVWGASMEPTFYTGERILVDKISVYEKPYKRGEIVVLIPPNEPDKHYIKRIIGMPGDIIKILDCHVFISKDGEKFELQEAYLSKDVCTQGGSSIKEGRSLKLEANQYMVLGDNRTFSLDSRFFGVIEAKEIVGRVIFVFWPLNKMGFIH